MGGRGSLPSFLALVLPNFFYRFPLFSLSTTESLEQATVFATPLYNATVFENSPIGTKILQVQASDADSGRNGQLSFVLVRQRQCGEPIFRNR